MMSQRLTLELPDNLYTAVEQAARTNAQSPDQWLLARLPDLLPVSFRLAENGETYGLWTAEEEAQFAAEEATFEIEWQQHLAEMDVMRHCPPPSAGGARAQVRDILADMGGPPLPAEAALELAMSEEIAEWNLNQD